MCVCAVRQQSRVDGMGGWVESLLVKCEGDRDVEV